MTEVEMAAARRVYELQTKRNPFERLASWVRSLLPASASQRRRARLDKKAEARSVSDMLPPENVSRRRARPG